jgi:hypothetical protein
MLLDILAPVESTTIHRAFLVESNADVQTLVRILTPLCEDHGNPENPKYLKSFKREAINSMFPGWVGFYRFHSPGAHIDFVYHSASTTRTDAIPVSRLTHLLEYNDG